MTTNCVRSFDRSGSAPVSDPEESTTRREGALPRRVVRSFPGLNNSRDSMDSRDWKKASDCTRVRMYEGTTVQQTPSTQGSQGTGQRRSAVRLFSCQLPAVSCQLWRKGCQLQAASCLLVPESRISIVLSNALFRNLG